MTKLYIGSGCLDNTGALLAELVKGRNAVVVSDTNAWPLYGERLLESLTEAGFRANFTLFEAGESSKNYQTLLGLYDAFHGFDLTRSGVVLALGGGVVGDVAGFAAATYLRGIPVVQVPTTLLAQVDSSIGGKTAIDMPFGKNTVGAFHMPIMVVSDPEVLETLPERVFADGMAEVIKYGCIWDSGLFEMCRVHERLQEIIKRCADIKVEIVAQDERDKGLRMLLNFGHTIGHAIEKCQNFSGMTHGEAVGIGMLKAAELGERLGITEAGTRERIEELLIINQLPTKVDLSVLEVSKALQADKKREDAWINFIFLQRIGQAVIRSYPLAEICSLLEETGL